MARAQAAVALTAAGRITEAQPLLRDDPEWLDSERAAVARIALEVALATGDSARIEAAQSRLRTWTQSPFVGGDRCSSAALASVADPGAPPLGALLDDDSPCHHAGLHAMWRRVAKSPPTHTAP